VNEPDRASAWEAAYRRFETPEEETRKFAQRLRRLGASGWPPSSRAIELFCGRGSGMRALAEAGIRSHRGADLSVALLALARGSGPVVAADCRRLPFREGAFDLAVVHGGLHHLLRLPEDLDLVLAETRRALAPRGLFVAVEPWISPFLRLVHALCRNRAVRVVWKRGDALATMIENERESYESWLSAPSLVLARLRAAFPPELCRVRWGKLYYVGRRA
jgi:SAM-dependent methyltransferase